MENLIPAHFQVRMNPVAKPEAVVQSGFARFAVLTERMIRIEWAPGEAFEDRASQPFWYREQPVPAFTSTNEDGELILDTAYLRLHYMTGEVFAKESLWVEVKQMNTTWHWGDPDPGNLGGTARTLDEVDGATVLSPGLVSRAGWSVVDDSRSLVFNESGWLEPRNAIEGQYDLYFLGYGHDYLGCLKDFNLVAGAVPMIPRFILGNWWSRYWAYTQDELNGLMDDFQAHDVPLSVCIIDMDWHITKTGNESWGWTGYTWNRELFPDPEGALRFLHEKGLKVALNLHPALGVYPHEEMYAEMCDAVGQDAAKKAPVEFDITNPRFVNAYFRILHHPQEERGVDFWWMDWQQGARTRLSGLDPLWWLNHLHFLDLGRDGKRRSFVFSRWGGLGNHRYPIGFSGDSVVTWASLAFQPYFTATSSNVNYGWWSHDIGGHMGGIEDSELYTRWVQLGVFQPVLRLHSTNNPYHERRPWGFDEETFAAAREAMQLRHSLIPYLYSMAWRFHRDSVPPILPMYYAYPEQEEAYACPNQYLYGSELIVSPFITPKDADTRLSRATAWLPKGEWYDFANGQYFSGDGWQVVYGGLRQIPVFAKAGAIVPHGPMAGWDNIDTPEHLIVTMFPGADGAFDLYEDEGNSNAYLNGEYAVTPLRLKWGGKEAVFTLGPVQGSQAMVPASREVELRFRGYSMPEQVIVLIDGVEVPGEAAYDAGTLTLTLRGIQIKPGSLVKVTLRAGDGILREKTDSRLATCMNLIKHFRMDTWGKADLVKRLPEIIEDPTVLGRYITELSASQIRALLETLTGAGMDFTTSTGKPLLVAWNNHQNSSVTYSMSLARTHNFWRFKERNLFEGGTLPKFQVYRPEEDFGNGYPWAVQVNYYDIGHVRETGG